MDNRRTIIAIALVLFVWTGFNFFFPPKTKNQTDPQNTQEQVLAPKKVEEAPPVVQQISPDIASTSVSLKPRVERLIKIKFNLFDLTFSTDGARLVDAQLNKFTKDNTPDSAFVKIIDNQPPSLGSYGTVGAEGFYLPGDLSYTASEIDNEVYSSSLPKNKLIFQAKTSDNLLVTKIFTFYPNKYFFDIDFILQNGSDLIKKGTVKFTIVSDWDDSRKGDRYNFVGPVSYNESDLFNDDIKDLKEKNKTYGSDILWTSFTTKYFSNIVKPFDISIKSLDISYKNNSVVNTITSSFLTLAPGQSQTLKYKSYVGPRNYELLKEPGLSFEHIIDLGFFGIIAKPLMKALTFFYGFLGNFGFAIVLLTVCIKAAFWPLTQKSYSSMNNMKKLQPQMQKLRAKYGKDKQKLNQEMMALYKENRVNPFGGCLPMLIQIPVFFALYRVLLESIELRHAPFMLWITDLSAPDTLISDALGLGFVLGPLPLIMGFTMFLQQKMTPTTMDPTQAKVMMFMPVFFTFIFLSFPSGLVVYWLVNNLLTIAQQYLINRKPA